MQSIRNAYKRHVSVIHALPWYKQPGQAKETEVTSCQEKTTYTRPLHQSWCR